MHQDVWNYCLVTDSTHLTVLIFLLVPKLKNTQKGTPPLHRALLWESQFLEPFIEPTGKLLPHTQFLQHFDTYYRVVISKNIRNSIFLIWIYVSLLWACCIMALWFFGSLVHCYLALSSLCGQVLQFAPAPQFFPAPLLKCCNFFQPPCSSVAVFPSPTAQVLRFFPAPLLKWCGVS